MFLYKSQISGECYRTIGPLVGVRVSVTFHLTCVHIIFSSVSVAEWSPFGK